VRITRVHVKNFRCLRDIEFRMEPLTILLGPNNSGKSSVLRALEFFFDSGARLEPEDFFCGADPEEPCVVEVEFGELDEQDKTTFRRYLLSGDRIRVQKICRRGDAGRTETEPHGIRNLPSDLPDWLNAERAGDYTTRASVAGLPEDFRAQLPESGRISKQQIEEAQLGRIVNDILAKMAASNEDFQRLQAQVGQMLDALSDPDGEARQEITAIEQQIERELSDWAVDVDISVVPPDMSEIFRLGTEVSVDDGVRTDMARKGHGLQRAMILALLRVWAGTIATSSEEPQEIVPRKKSASSYWAIEEPELYLHPQAQRRMLGALREIAAAIGEQVIITTHSSFFVDMELYRAICVMERPDREAGAIVLQCEDEPFDASEANDARRLFNLTYWLNPDRNELFFARKVVLVEGHTEKAALPIVAQRLGVWDDAVSVVACEGKHNIRTFMRVLNGFGIKYCVVHDADTGNASEEAENARIANELNRLIGEVVVLEPDFEQVAGIDAGAIARFGKPMAASQHFSNGTNLIPNELDEAARKAFG